MLSKIFPLLVTVLFLFACSDDVLAPANPGNLSNERITITNEALELNGRVTYFEDIDVPIDIGQGKPRGPLSITPQAFQLKLVAEVSPPSINGQVLQATSVDMKGNFAIVSYSMVGAQYLGGIDVINITNKKKPRLESGALFQDSDLNAIFYDTGKVFAAQATGDTSFATPSACEVMTLQGFYLVLDGDQRASLTSFAGTGVFATGTRIFATSGDAGGLAVFDRSTLNPITSIGLHDARWTHMDGGKIVVVQGTPGQISIFNESDLSPAGTFSFAGADVPQSKSTVEVTGGKAFIAAGTGGVQILSVNTGAVVGSVPRPDPVSLGLDPSVVVTNAVAVDNDLLFISNGEAGVYVAQGSAPFATTGSEELQQITVLGQLQFNQLQSVNHVAFKNNYLIVAAGLGGLKIVQVIL